MKTRIKRRYSQRFIDDAINLAMNSDKSLVKIANSLGVPLSTIKQWVGVYKRSREDIMKNKSKSRELTPIEKENARLQKQNADLKMERDILKKTLAIFTKPEE